MNEKFPLNSEGGGGAEAVRLGGGGGTVAAQPAVRREAPSAPLQSSNFRGPQGRCLRKILSNTFPAVSVVTTCPVPWGRAMG